MRYITANFTRPANTTAYDAGDVINNSTSAPVIMTFTGASEVPGGSGMIVSGFLVDGAASATKADLELWLFRTAMTMDNDNAAFTPTAAELQAFIGVVDLGVTPNVGTASGNAVYQSGPTSNLPLPFRCAAGVQDIYGVLVVRNAYTPVSAETFFVNLWIVDE